MPRLIVIKGADEGKQFPLTGEVLPAGRDSTSLVRLTDTEASRRHAEFVRTPDGGYRVRDVGSANGTFVNNQSVHDVLLQPGDHVQIGQTVLVYTPDGPSKPAAGDLADRINLISRYDDLPSAIVGRIPDTEGSRILANPRQAGSPWLENALANLTVLYEVTQTVSAITDLEQLLERIMDLVFRTLDADRGCILLRPPASGAGGEGEAGRPFEAKAVRARVGQDGERIPVSRTIRDYVLAEKQGIRVNDAASDQRFQTAQSIVRASVREVICVPMRGRHETLGVLYLDTATAAQKLAATGQASRFDDDHLRLAAAIAHQAALAVEATRYHQAMVNAERLAAIGQTIATLSHHIKNILQGLRSASDVVELGFRDHDEQLIRDGWKSVQKNQGRISDLVMDMLSYSKEREPVVEPTDLNKLVRDVLELAQSRATERGVQLRAQYADSLPRVPADFDGLHRALLNVVTNAIDAVEGAEKPIVKVGVLREPDGEWVQIVVADNGPGIPPALREEIFRPFISTKGSRGTGLGLPVSRKVLREHGGDIRVQSEEGKGSRFALRLPMRSPLLPDAQSTRTDLPVAPPPE